MLKVITRTRTNRSYTSTMLLGMANNRALETQAQKLKLDVFLNDDAYSTNDDDMVGLIDCKTRSLSRDSTKKNHGLSPSWHTYIAMRLETFVLLSFESQKLLTARMDDKLIAPPRERLMTAQPDKWIDSDHIMVEGS
jgi:hypothetical protein